MKLSELLDLAGVEALSVSGEADITSLVCDSRKVTAGACFVAIAGPDSDGHNFIGQAIDAGCAAVICQNAKKAPINVPAVVLDDTHRAIGPLAQAMRGWPARKLSLVGITGTNGKSTIAWILRRILDRAGHSAGLLGTISYDIAGRVVPAGNTTPGPVELAEMMSALVDAGGTHLVMEVSSHALDQDRVSGLEFRAGIFTNLTGDHLDYHGDMDAYRVAKRKLFESLGPDAVGVINRDDPYADAFADACACPVAWYGLSPASDFYGRIERIDASGTVFTIVTADRELPVDTPLIGRHNVYNCLAAACGAASLGVAWDVIGAALHDIDRIPGRLERVPADRPFDVFVDYAHTHDALDNVLSSLQALTKGKLIVVFGCGGDRDRTKRPKMARVAQTRADRIFITSDNPRSESPEAIIEEIVAGLNSIGRERTAVEPDRRAAIGMAIDEAKPGDVVLIAGKGHETYQIIGAERFDFDDVQVARDMLEGR
jgi:UDP-N-acetylmuramoyl-L-alanyl-D-glutamate--2,6-diaminopimelate ligase